METITLNKLELEEVVRTIVHDCRNHLQLANNFAFILAKKFPDGEAKRIVDIIISSNEKSQALTDNLLKEILSKAI